jgi:WD40 repeat protein
MYSLILSLQFLQFVQAGDPPPKVESPLRPQMVRSLAFSPDGKTLIGTSGRKDQPGTIIAWDAETQKLLWRYQTPGIYASVSFAPDGKTVAVTHNKSTALQLDSITGLEIGEIGPHPTSVRTLVHIPGTNLLATGSDVVIRLWDLKSGKVHQELKGHRSGVDSLVVSPNGRWLLSTDDDGTRIWDIAAGSELKGTFPAERGRHWAIVFVTDNKAMLSDNFGTQRILELPAFKELLRFQNSGGSENPAYSASAGLAAFRYYGDAAVWIADLTFRTPSPIEQAQIEKLVKDFDDDSYEVRTAASSEIRKLGSVTEPALRAAMTSGPAIEVKVRARETLKAILNEPLRQLKGHTGSVGPMAFSPDGKVLATGADDGTVRLWNPKTGKELARLEFSLPR